MKPHPAYAPPLDVPIPVEPGYYDRVAAACLHQAIDEAKAGSLAALAWLTDDAPPFGGMYVARCLPADTAEALLNDLLTEWARRPYRA